MTQNEARLIAQDFLDRQGEATISGDLELTLDWCDIPCTLETMGNKVVAQNHEEMRAICVAFIQRLKTKRFTHMVRQCIEAAFVDENTLSAAYETRFVSDGAHLAEGPYYGFVILRKRETGWKISSMQFADDSENSVDATLKNRSLNDK